MTSREKFEQAIKSRFGDLIDYRVCKNSDGEYMAWDMQVAWWAWQAAETDLAVQLANAESKCRELASENAALKSFGDKLYSMYKGLETSGGGFHDEQSIPYQQAALDAAISAFEEIKTPATDAFLSELRAQGVDASIEHLSMKFEGTGHIGVPVMALEWLAKEIRKGAAQ